MKKAGLNANWRQGSNLVKMQVSVMLFTEKKVHVAYIPVLDLSGYGNTEEEAIHSLQIVLDNYLDYTIKKNTLLKDLEKHGWQIKRKNKPFIAPELTALISTNEYLHDIFNKKKYTVTQFPVALPELNFA